MRMRLMEIVDGMRVEKAQEACRRSKELYADLT
jgi:hypothetical protein